MMYPSLFKSGYSLHGRDWVRRIDPEDLRVFVDIGLAAADFGRKGGKALVAKRGSEYMSKIGRRGAIVTNIQKQFKAAVKDENEKELGVYLTL